MALDFREITKTIIDTVKAAIGDDLTQTPDPDNVGEEYGLVMIARPNPEKPIPDYPYAVVDVTAFRDDDWHLTNLCYDEINDQFSYVTVQQIDFQISIYGSNSTMSALALASKLKSAYRTDTLLQILYDGGLGLVDVEQVQISPELLQTDFLEVAFVQMSVRVNDVDVDPDLESIENVVADGELFDSLDNDPITIDIDTTS